MTRVRNRPTVVVELTIPEVGSYPFVMHSFANASKGVVGVIKVER